MNEMTVANRNANTNNIFFVLGMCSFVNDNCKYFWFDFVENDPGFFFYKNWEKLSCQSIYFRFTLEQLEY